MTMRQSRPKSSSTLHRLGMLLASAAVRRSLLLALAIASVLLFTGVGRSEGVAGLAVVGLAALALTVALLGLVGLMIPLAGIDTEAEQIAEALAADELQQRLLTRWLERARRARFVGGLAGCIVWALAFRMRSDLLAWGSIGICVGASAAELHHLRRPPGPRTASLDVRALTDYLPNTERNRMIGVAVAAATTGLTAVVVDGPSTSVAWAALALLLLGAIHLAQRRVTTRGRPALTESLRQADDLARYLAVSRGLARPATYAGLAMVARSLVNLRVQLPIGPLLGLTAWCLAAGLWWRNRRLGIHVADKPHREVAHA